MITIKATAFPSEWGDSKPLVGVPEEVLLAMQVGDSLSVQLTARRRDDFKLLRRWWRIDQKGEATLTLSFIGPL